MNILEPWKLALPLLEMSSAPIIIVGAGLAGVTAGRCLLSKGLLPLIIEKASSSLRRHDYSIELHSATYRPLLSVLGLDEAAFKRQVSVYQHGAITAPSQTQPEASRYNDLQDSFRCHRGRLENLLREGLNIKWEHTVRRVALGPSHICVEADNGPPLETAVLVAADGVHSAVRKALIPDFEAYVHPYVVFYGTRKVTGEYFARNFAGETDSGRILEARHDDAFLRVFINNITSTEVLLGYTYSRPAHVAMVPDALHRPERSIEGAKDTPEAFYSELSDLKNLNPACNEIFDPVKVRQDRVLHWLMRSAIPQHSDTAGLAEKGVLMVGDAVHAMPIIGGEGGNLAIRDGMELADWIVANKTSRMEEFMSTRYQQWKDNVEKGVQTLQNMHKDERPSL